MHSYFNWFLNKRLFPDKTNTSESKAEPLLLGGKERSNLPAAKTSREVAGTEAGALTQAPQVKTGQVRKHHTGKQPL